jgi:hypothetical protein
MASGSEERRGTLEQRIIFWFADRLPAGGRVARAPFAVRIGLAWLLGVLVLVPAALVMPVGISEFSGLSGRGRVGSMLAGWTLCVLLWAPSSRPPGDPGR